MGKEKRDQIGLAAHRLRVLVGAAMASATLLYLAGRMGVRIGHLNLTATHSSTEPMAMSVIRDVSAVLVLLALAQIAAMLGRIADGERFSTAVTLRLRRFASLLFLDAVLSLIGPPLAILASDPSPVLMLPLSFRDVWMMLVTSALLLVARLLDQAQQIESDLGEIV